jgi:hypothetical protein
VTDPGWKRQSQTAKAMQHQLMPMSRLFSTRPSSRRSQRRRTQSMNSAWRWNSRNGMAVGSLVPALRLS